MLRWMHHIRGWRKTDRALEDVRARYVDPSFRRLYLLTIASVEIASFPSSQRLPHNHFPTVDRNLTIRWRRSLDLKLLSPVLHPSLTTKVNGIPNHTTRIRLGLLLYISRARLFLPLTPCSTRMSTRMQCLDLFDTRYVPIFLPLRRPHLPQVYELEPMPRDSTRKLLGS
jgi:hypothetical protein